VRGFDICYPRSHNFDKIFCRLQTVSVPDLGDPFASNVRNFQWVAAVDCVQLQSEIFFIWYELESLFNLVFNFNNSYSDGNDHRVRKIALGNQTACCSTHLRAGSQQGYQGDQNYFNNHWSVLYLLLSNIMRIYSASDRPGRG